MTTEARRSAVRVLVAVVLAAAVTAAAAGCADAGDAEPEHRTFALGNPEKAEKAVEAGKPLVVDTNGDLELVAADRSDVRVTRWFAGYAYGGSTGAKWSLKDGTLTLRTACKGPANCDIRHRVELPEGLALRVENDNGDVTARGFRGALGVVSDNGDVRVRDSSGPLDLFSDNGSVRATGVGSRRVSAKSDNGGIELALARVPDRVAARSDNGDVTVELPRAAYRVDATSGDGDTEVAVDRDRAGKRVVSAHSDNGDVTVRNVN
ncbi:DUF4097 family beta strand repeat-containing protein [Streptomyces sp. TRM 70361]|uniref:DUF4097 family beta strand repeat-containing protein n=1 Tax=Streptomyces sp. TRM 70361 TaxID=3116553 RepID=UPI002E7AB027|nr:DUF4097 family beta strand repeat-containing protein [Streptomyces sp. TRM 70361]MEE1939776.1 DUF4097 family beta strand repeat-containing protein [Streptomyces sp. TRM 70361]